MQTSTQLFEPSPSRSSEASIPTASLSSTRLNAFARPAAPGDRIEVYVEPTPEQLFWVKTLEGLVSPPDNRGSWATRVLARVGVTPIAHLAWGSLNFQAYLYELFHQTLLARFWHFVLMPLVLVAGMVFLAPFTLWGEHPTSHAPVLFAGNGALLLAGALAVWYFLEAVAERMLLWGVVMVGLVAGLLVTANLIYSQTFVLDSTLRTWYAAVSWPWNPLLWMAVMSVIIAFSHLLEPDLPPRVSKTSHWMPVMEFIRGTADKPHSLGKQLVRGIELGLQGLYGSLDEFWATPRLFPVGVLRQLWNLGYQRDRQQALARLVERALQEGNPALDYIGTGGGAFLQIPKQ